MEINDATKKIMADFLDDLREYMHESHNNFMAEERTSMEFVEIYNNKFSESDTEWISYEENVDLFKKAIKEKAQMLIKFNTGVIREYSDEDWPHEILAYYFILKKIKWKIK